MRLTLSRYIASKVQSIKLQSNLLQRDRKLVWHPFTQEKTADPYIPVKRASGAYVYDENDKPYLDLLSSWWVNIHGHCHPEIVEAIYQQCKTLDHVIFGGCTHEPAVKYCEMFKKILPNELTKFFYSDNGSTAVEIALKMCYQYWVNEGTARDKFLCFDGDYHGDTVGSMSVGVGSGYHNQFRKLMFPVTLIPFPNTWIGDDEAESKESDALKVLEDHLNKEGHKFAALILEPLLQGAIGFRMCRPQFLNKVAELVKKYDIFVIFDEVMTGFGRTGTNFAFEQTNVVPDVICVSKGITGGFLPLSLTVTTEKMYQAFYKNEYDQAFFHGHSYTANPISCAAATASLKLLVTPGTVQSIEVINKTHKKCLEKLLNNCSHNIHRGRVVGTISAFDVKDRSIIKKIERKALEHGILIRPLADCIYLLPPYCVTAAELEDSYHKIEHILNSL